MHNKAVTTILNIRGKNMASSIPEMLRAECKCEDMAKCVLGLKELDINTYKTLLEHGALTAESLGEILGRERSTAYRSLQNLISAGLVYRETKSISIGGYYYEYVAIEPVVVKEMIRKTIDQWYHKMNDLIENFDKELIA
jgi:predicted transcriptional regulator